MLARVGPLVVRCSTRRFRAECGDLDASSTALASMYLISAGVKGSEIFSLSGFDFRLVLAKEKILEPVILTEGRGAMSRGFGEKASIRSRRVARPISLHWNQGDPC